MLVLAFDTAMTRCSVALGADGRCLAKRGRDMARGQAEALLPMIAETLEAAGVTDMARLAALAVIHGPGSFTGVRIAVAAARGLACALAIPVVSLTSLEVVAAQAAAAWPQGAGTLLVVQDARRGEVYGQVFAMTAGALPVAKTAPALLTLAQARRRAQAAALVAGTAAALVGNKGSAAVSPADPLPRAATMLRVAQGRPARPHGEVHPFYLRPPDAKLPALNPVSTLRQRLHP
ncbi:MAG: tRNA (adenosine(37)-N6)-threonylcarbamoyltransferase complex dimerization subunit type 1 TsaB [Pseudomonadota bacterium]|jgi:tRNA threonylcarbamoyladenosine biosynthesis protein TsaB